MDPIEPLDDDARELLATYRSERPGPHGRARNWPAVRSRAAADAPRPAAGRRSSLWIGGVAFALAAAILLVVRAVFGAWQALQAQQVTPPAASDVVDAPVPIEVAPARAPAVAPAPSLPAAAPSAPPQPVAVPVQRPEAPTKAAMRSPAKDTARDEVELVRVARDSLVGEDWAAALAALDEHARRFADGVLAEERSALRAIALCRSGAANAREAVLAFNSRYPGSHHHRSIELACDERSKGASP